ncbi:S8 family serine peptidase [Actinacidiphila glaucinigra]|uniref:S8 family serine peptidase n=1 Tax=Actinacidiphila glaucinigra TaxID=235986 RepID=UPI0033BC0E2E
MRPHTPARQGLPILAAVTALLTVIPPATAADHAPAAVKGVPIADGGSLGSTPRTVTLVTGDRVTVTPGSDGPATVTVAAPNGDRANVRVSSKDGDVYVVPAAAERHLAAGLLDEALFNVTRLVADGYDDSRSRGLPLILSYSSDSLRKKDLASLPEGATGARTLTSIDSTAVTQSHGRAADFWAELTQATSAARGTAAGEPSLSGGVRKVWLDGKVKATLESSVAQIGAPDAWARGNTGKGVDVAVLDTGYDSEHPDLAGAVASSRSFIPYEDVVDRNGHGTHVASTIAGSGAASDGKEKGVAPGAELHVGKVLDNSGSGADSWVIAGMEWAARETKARVISMSLGGFAPDDGTDPLSQAVNALSAETGALFTIAAGNNGENGASTVASPGSADAALTVGAVDSTDTVASFSSRGPRFRDDAIKPEITAPGVGILAARSQYATFGSGSYASLNGTSMATPHVAGAAALVAARHPQWSGARIKDALVSTAAETPANTADDGGNGRVDAAAASSADVVATGTADAGIHSLGGKPGQTVDRRIEWLNSGDKAVTLTLRVDAPDAPQGLFTVGDRQVTVPAGGTAATTLTAVLDRAPAGSRFTAHLTGLVDGKPTTRTLLAVSTREEYHHLRLHFQGRDGEPLANVVRVQRHGDGARFEGVTNTRGDIDLVAPNGVYTAWMWGDVRGTHGASSLGQALLVKTGIRIHDADTSVTVDGRELRPTEVVTPQKTTAGAVRADFFRSFTDGSPAIGEASTLAPQHDSLWALPAGKPTDGDLLYTVRARMEQPLLSLSSGPQEFDDLTLEPGAARPADRTHTLPAVFAGDGREQDYAAAGARGKVAVVRYVPLPDGDDDRDSRAVAHDQIAAAEKAGVAVLVIVNGDSGRYWPSGSRSKIVVAGVSRTEGEILIDRIQRGSGSVPMHITGRSTTDYLYDLVRTWRGGIPKTLRYAPGKKELARVDVDFRTTDNVYENRFDIQPYQLFQLDTTRLSTSGARRTDWVTAAPDAVWREEAHQSGSQYSDQYSGRVAYPAGRATNVQWFGPIERPRIVEYLDTPRRSGDFVLGQIPGFGDGGRNHAGTNGPGTTAQSVELHRSNKLLGSTDGPYFQFALPSAASRYRLVTTTKHTEGYPYSTSTRTEWGFTSEKPRNGNGPLLPLVQLDYAIRTSTDGTARRDAELVVEPSHIPGASTARVRTDKVEVSYDDGRTWQRVRLRDLRDGAARVTLDAPRKAAFLSLRVHASDTRGGTVTQTVIRATGLG